MKLYRNIFLHTSLLTTAAFAILLAYTAMVITLDPASLKKMVLFGIGIAILAVGISMLIHWSDLNSAVKLSDVEEKERFSSPEEWLEMDKYLAAYPRVQGLGTVLIWTTGAGLVGLAFHLWRHYLSLNEMFYVVIGGLIMGSITGSYNYFFFKLHLAPLRRALAPPFPPPGWKPLGSMRNLLSSAFFAICMAMTFFPATVVYVQMERIQSRVLNEKTVRAVDRGDFGESSRRLLRFMGIVVSLALVMATGLILLVRRYLGGSIENLVSEVEAVAEGDLERQIKVYSDGEIGTLERSLGLMKDRLVQLIRMQSGLVQQIGSSVEQLVEAASSLKDVSGEQSAVASEQAGAVQEAKVTAEEVKSSSATISERVNAVSEMAAETLDATKKGSTASVETVESIRNIEQKVQVIADKMLTLGENIQNIGKIADTIGEISQQTNLLAINAGIEASSAGEAGERFGVVAAEIRKLAQSTAKSAVEVRQQVEQIRKAAAESVIYTEEGTKSVAEGLKKVEAVAEAFSMMENIAEKTSQSSSEIAMSIRQQTTATEQVAQTMEELSSATAQVAEGAKTIDAATEQLDRLADALKKMVSGQAG